MKQKRNFSSLLKEIQDRGLETHALIFLVIVGLIGVILFFPKARVVVSPESLNIIERNITLIEPLLNCTQSEFSLHSHYDEHGEIIIHASCRIYHRLIYADVTFIEMVMVILFGLFIFMSVNSCCLLCTLHYNDKNKLALWNYIRCKKTSTNQW